MHILQFIQLLTFYNLSITSSLKSGFIARYGNCPQTIAILLCAVTWSNSVFVLYGFSGSQCRKTNPQQLLCWCSRAMVLSVLGKSLCVSYPKPWFFRDFTFVVKNFGFNHPSTRGLQNEEYITNNNRKI
ncbi:hypothetical protein HJG60_010203 [Phyllostomus discolor]|uniref:Uncharacterized protein n=1 Tax=Phyllostomus discolor TaxID=89673 RepID=A0A834EJR1_9CHIR|nr:hypothetical protein HJG60_010203 [Phyllostomus discolor]